MNAKYPDSNTTSAEEGTAAHWVMAEMLDGIAVPEDSLTPNGQTVTQEMLEGAHMVCDVVAERMDGTWRLKTL